MPRSGKPPEMLARLIEMGVRTLVEQFGAALGLSELQAEVAMREIAHDLAKNYGGAYIYVPKDHKQMLTTRDVTIFEELRRDNVNEVALKHGLSVQQIYAINRRVREQMRRQNQPALPGLEG